jgi:hypothetical protein
MKSSKKLLRSMRKCWVKHSSNFENAWKYWSEAIWTWKTSAVRRIREFVTYENANNILPISKNSRMRTNICILASLIWKTKSSSSSKISSAFDLSCGRSTKALPINPRIDSPSNKIAMISRQSMRN